MKNPSIGFLPATEAYRPISSSVWDITLSARGLLVLVFMLMIFTCAARPVIDPDFWWHLRTGQHLVESLSIPHTDIFSSVFFGREWVTHEWLSELLVYSLYHAFGLVALVVTFSLVVTAGFWIAYQRCAPLAGHPYVSGFALVLGAVTAQLTWGVRPQMFTFLFASIYVAVLDQYIREEKRNLLWWLAPLMIVWVNMHAGFAMGLALILLTIIGLTVESVVTRKESIDVTWRHVRPLLLVLIVCGAAVLLNPHGPRMYLYPFETLKSKAMMKYIEEWFSPNFHELMFQPLLIMIAATFSVLALSGKRVRLVHLVLLLATAVGALRSSRNIPFFVLVAMPLLTEHAWDWITQQRWGQWLTRPEKREVGRQAVLKMALNLIVLAVLPITAAAVRVHHVVASQSAAEAETYPVAAVNFMREQKLPQPIFNDYGWGGYLIWKLYPDYRVYIDGRADVYGDAFMEEFLSAQAGEKGWRAPLDKYGIRTVLIKPDTALASLLREDAGWQKVFEDSQAVIFTRK